MFLEASIKARPIGVFAKVALLTNIQHLLLCLRRYIVLYYIQ